MAEGIRRMHQLSQRTRTNGGGFTDFAARCLGQQRYFRLGDEIDYIPISNPVEECALLSPLTVLREVFRCACGTRRQLLARNMRNCTADGRHQVDSHGLTSTPNITCVSMHSLPGPGALFSATPSPCGVGVASCQREQCSPEPHDVVDDNGIRPNRVALCLESSNIPVRKQDSTRLQ